MTAIVHRDPEGRPPVLHPVGSPVVSRDRPGVVGVVVEVIEPQPKMGYCGPSWTDPVYLVEFPYTGRVHRSQDFLRPPEPTRRPPPGRVVTPHGPGTFVGVPPGWPEGSVAVRLDWRREERPDGSLQWGGGVVRYYTKGEID